MEKENKPPVYQIWLKPSIDKVSKKIQITLMKSIFELKFKQKNYLLRRYNKIIDNNLQMVA